MFDGLLAEPRSQFARGYPCILELAKCQRVPDNRPIPIYVPTIDLSHRENLRRCQEEYRERSIDPNGTSNSPLLQLPTVTINGSKYDIRTLAEDQFALVNASGNNDQPSDENSPAEYRPLLQELARTEQVPTNSFIPLYVPTIDMSGTSDFRMCQQHFKGRCIHLSESADGDAILQLPTITVAGKKYDLRTMTAEQIDLLQESSESGTDVSEEAFLQAGTSGRMYEPVSFKDLMTRMGL